MIVQKELVAIYDYEVPVPEDPFSFRLEIHKCVSVNGVPY